MSTTEEQQSTSTEASDTGNAPSQPSKRAKLKYTLPNDRINFSKQLDIIRAYPAAYAKSNAPVTNKEVGDIIGMAETTVSMANAFLTDIGLLSGESGKFTPATELMEYLRVHQLSPDKAWSKLVPLFERSWFGQELITKLRFRPMTEKDALEDLALKAGAEQRHFGQLKVGIDWLVQVGLVQREGATLKLAQAASMMPQEAPVAPTSTASVNAALQEEESDDSLHKATLRLDAAGKRKVIIYAPPMISKKELDRINQWLSVQLIVEE